MPGDARPTGTSLRLAGGEDCDPDRNRHGRGNRDPDRSGRGRETLLESAGLLTSNAFLRVLPAPVLAQLEGRCVRKRLADGQCLFSRGDAPDGLYGLVRGQIRVVGRGPDGRELLLILLDPGQWFGEISLFDGLPRTHDAYARGETELLVLPRRDFRDILDASPALYRPFLELLCHRLRMAFAMIEDATLLDLGARLARRLLGLLDDHGEEAEDGMRIALHLPQEDLARMIGATREAVGRHLKAWEREGVIRLEYGRIVVRERAMLDELARSSGAG